MRRKTTRRLRPYAYTWKQTKATDTKHKTKDELEDLSRDLLKGPWRTYQKRLSKELLEKPTEAPIKDLQGYEEIGLARHPPITLERIY